MAPRTEPTPTINAGPMSGGRSMRAPDCEQQGGKRDADQVVGRPSDQPSPRTEQDAAIDS
jgi:hypothetical protein